MRQLGLCLLGVAALSFTPASAAVAAEDCDGSTVEIVACIDADMQRWDVRLNAAYQEAMRRVPSPQRESLRAAQRLWIQYRDANCRFYAMGEGSIAQIEASECRRTMTRQRAEELANGTQ